MRAIGVVIMVWLFGFVAMSQTTSQQNFVVKPIPEPAEKVQAVLNFQHGDPLLSSLSSGAKEILYFINVARSQPQYFWDSLVCPILEIYPQLKGRNSKSLYTDLIRVSPLPMFRLHNKLNKSAQAHSDDMGMQANFFSHNSSNGQTFGDRMKALGINTYCAENISMGQQSILLSVVLLYLDIGVPDLGHRKTLLNPIYTRIGVGYAEKANGSFYFVEDFSSEME